jgi:hypothetical protein
MGIVIADETTHFSVTLDTNVARTFPKNSALMDRKDDRFQLVSVAEQGRLLQKFNTEDVTTPVHVAVKATGTYTVSSSIVEGTHAESVVTANTIVSTDTVTIGTTVYQFIVTPVAAYDVALGASDAAALDNLKLAINASGVGDGTDYFAGTLVHPTVVATDNADTTQKIVSKLQGTASNSVATTSVGGTLTWADSSLGGGTGASTAGVAGDTLTIGDVTYTFVDVLSEDNEDDESLAVANQVHWVTNDATALDNLKLAINLGLTIGTNYSTGTVIHPIVTATTNADGAQTVEAKVAGNEGNIASTAVSGDSSAWAATTLVGGLDQADVLATNLAAIIYTAVA